MEGNNLQYGRKYREGRMERKILQGRGKVLRIFCEKYLGKGITILSLSVALALAWSGAAKATAMMNVLYDGYDIQAETIWGVLQGEPASSTDKSPGTVESAVHSGSIFSNGHDSTGWVMSNMAFAHADIDFYQDQTEFQVLTSVNVDDDIQGSRGGYGTARSNWQVLFEITGDNAELDAGGILWRGHQALLEDRTSGFNSSYDLFDIGHTVSLLAGHLYSLSIGNWQENWGSDDLTVTAVTFRNVQLRVPEASAFLLFGSGLFGIVLLCWRRGAPSLPA